LDVIDVRARSTTGAGASSRAQRGLAVFLFNDLFDFHDLIASLYWCGPTNSAAARWLLKKSDKCVVRHEFPEQRNSILDLIMG
jgi:hypothetical protein